MKSWNSAKHPVFEADQMPVPVHWNPMNEDWKTRLTKSQIYNTSSGFDSAISKILCQKYGADQPLGERVACLRDNLRVATGGFCHQNKLC